MSVLGLTPVFEDTTNGPDDPILRPIKAVVSDGDHDAFLRSLCDYNQRSPRGSLRERIQRLAEADECVLAGGLIASKDDFSLLPGCCCGLEDWTEWKGLSPGTDSPWLGHDPSPWVETLEDLVMLHAGGALDESPDKITRDTLEVSYEELNAAVARAESDLISFMTGLRECLRHEYGTTGDKLARKIAGWFSIPTA